MKTNLQGTYPRDPMVRALVRKEAELKALIEAVQALPLPRTKKPRTHTRIAAKYCA
jgi:hypothetical protein